MTDPRHTRRVVWVAWVALLLLAAAMRLCAPAWDAGIAAHPDERFLLGAARSVSLWGNPSAEIDGFPYGHLPLYLARLLVLAGGSADPLYAARLVSGLIGVLLVAAAGAWGRRLAGEWGGWVAAATLACAPFPIQEAHFYTVDPLAALLSSLALLVALRRRYLAAGLLAGCALACKASMVWLGGGMLAALWLTTVAGPLPTRWWSPLAWWCWQFRPRLRPALVLLWGGLIGFVDTSPWSLLDPTRNWAGPLTQASLVAGRLDYPYVRQYAGTLPYLYPLEQMAVWGLGGAAVAAGLVGLALALRGWRRRSPALRVAWLWTVGYFAATAGLCVKFPRYLLPIYPCWAAWAARFVILDLRFWIARPAIRHSVCVICILAPTALLGLAQLSIYAQPHPWVAASRWIYETAPTGSVLAVEHWDYPLPAQVLGGSADSYTQYELPVFDPDTPDKAAQLQAALEQADAIILASRRGYGALVRLPERYAATLGWYERLFTAPKRQVYAFARCPRLGPLALSDDPIADAGLPVPVTLAERCAAPLVLRLPRLDESFRVYDAPLVLIFVAR